MSKVHKTHWYSSETVICILYFINTDCEALEFNYESIITSHYLSVHDTANNVTVL